MSEFKSCTSCGASWESRQDFLADGDVLMVGYQSSYTVSKPGLFLFNHACGSTLAVDATDFQDMYNEEICQSCEAHHQSGASHCCKDMTGEDEPDSCVCKFSQTIECKLDDLMQTKSTDG